VLIDTADESGATPPVGWNRSASAPVPLREYPTEIGLDAMESVWAAGF
jgi:hypothetical protein